MKRYITMSMIILSLLSCKSMEALKGIKKIEPVHKPTAAELRQLKKKRLNERIAQYCDALIGKNMQTIYGLHTPQYKDKVPPVVFGQKHPVSASVTGAFSEKERCEISNINMVDDNNSAEVKLLIYIRFYLGGRSSNMQTTDRELVWRYLGDEWFMEEPLVENISGRKTRR